jgi:sugar transferase (PEP-CTERM/EpsH1 system associated)
MAEYVFRSRALNLNEKSRPKLIMDLVDVDSDKWQQYAKKSRGLIKYVYLLESQLLNVYEKKVVESFDSTILVSNAEAEMLKSRTGVFERVFGVANGVDLAYFSPSDNFKGRANRLSKKLVFCGAMDYFPNVDAVTWFVNEVLPILRKLVGEVEFIIVGGKPTESVKALEKVSGVTVTGRVEDVRPFVWDADLSIAPIRVARGIQNKVLEAMALGTPVLATPEAFEGIDADPMLDLRIATAVPKLFAESAAELLEDSTSLNAIRNNARKTVEDKYHWNKRLELLNELFS